MSTSSRTSWTPCWRFAVARVLASSCEALAALRAGKPMRIPSPANTSPKRWLALEPEQVITVLPSVRRRAVSGGGEEPHSGRCEASRLLLERRQAEREEAERLRRWPPLASSLLRTACQEEPKSAQRCPSATAPKAPQPSSPARPGPHRQGASRPRNRSSSDALRKADPPRSAPRSRCTRLSEMLCSWFVVASPVAVST